MLKDTYDVILLPLTIDPMVLQIQYQIWNEHGLFHPVPIFAGQHIEQTKTANLVTDSV